MFHSKRWVEGNVPKNKRKSEKRQSLREIEKYLRNSITYMGAVFVKSFKKLLVKAEKYSLIVYCDFHWFCVYSTKKSFEIFDPLGFLQKSKCITNKFFTFLKSHTSGKTLFCNPKIQSDSSKLCGFYSVFYIYMRELGHSFSTILSMFSKNFRKNDQVIKRYIKKLKSRI